MYPYNQNLRPPAPSVPVRMINPVTRLYVDMAGLLDTGASNTVMPEWIAYQLGLRQVGQTTLLGVERVPIQVSLYQARWEVAGVRLGVLNVASTNFPHILLGRDILNQFDIMLRGKMQVCEMTTSEVA